LHTCWCIVFGCLDSNLGLNSKFVCCLNRFGNRNLKKKEKKERKEQTAAAATHFSPPQPTSATAAHRSLPAPLRLTRGTRVSSPTSRPSPTRTLLAPRRRRLRLGPASRAGPTLPGASARPYLRRRRPCTALSQAPCRRRPNPSSPSVAATLVRAAASSPSRRRRSPASVLLFGSAAR
jgi:hypothetical protein